jgi:hypothetical protein
MASDVKVNIILYYNNEPVSIGFDFTPNIDNRTLSEDYLKKVMSTLTESMIRNLIQNGAFNA